MDEKIRVGIRGKEYSLKGSDEKTILSLAKEVDSTMTNIDNSYSNLKEETIAVLAALNFAELKNEIENQKKTDDDYLMKELNKMSENLSKALND